MSRTKTLMLAALLAAIPAAGHGADLSCNGLVPSGSKMICPGFEPNWAVELACIGQTMTSNFIDAFTGDTITTTPGTVDIATENPWSFSTSHGVTGTIANTPGGCTDEADRVHDFTLTPIAVPGYDGPYFPICCRIE